MFFKLRPGEFKDSQMESASVFISRERRMVFLRGPITGFPERFDTWSPIMVHDAILAYNIEDSKKPIYLLIDSPGGSVDAGFMLYDVIRGSPAPIVTIGQTCASMATILLMAGKRRLIYPNSRVMMHQVSCSAAGDPRDIEITSNEIKRIRDQLTRAYIDCGVNRTAKQIDKDTAKEHWLSPADAVAYGIVDAIIQPEDWKRFISGEDM